MVFLPSGLSVQTFAADRFITYFMLKIEGLLEYLFFRSPAAYLSISALWSVPQVVQTDFELGKSIRIIVGNTKNRAIEIVDHFHIITTQEICKEDSEFVVKMIKIDLRD
jgi:hypothetical protein